MTDQTSHWWPKYSLTLEKLPRCFGSYTESSTVLGRLPQKTGMDSCRLQLIGRPGGRGCSWDSFLGCHRNDLRARASGADVSSAIRSSDSSGRFVGQGKGLVLPKMGSSEETEI